MNRLNIALVALLAIITQCLSRFRLLLTRNPRSFTSSVLIRGVLPMVHVVGTFRGRPILTRQTDVITDNEDVPVLVLPNDNTASTHILTLIFHLGGVRRDCRVHPIPGSWFGFPAQANQAFHPSGVGELVPDLSGKDRALTCSSAGHRKSLYGQIRIRVASTTSRRSRMRWRIPEGID
ncbi:unnamed protein product [Heligmosomoides polygyrus]|uniref:Uncharacterized protein n=1 Tax=Heligmosomoides polygyrus TaxID=6339 RepID=A0A3P7Y0Y2_HELPZ|nr:unnamed protein product [Heligmosomoides polygyrus]